MNPTVLNSFILGFGIVCTCLMAGGLVYLLIRKVVRASTDPFIDVRNVKTKAL